jgi:DNA mismatch endonuclease, patch repair protein
MVDGCFWHSCPQHGNRPAVNAEYWSAKLERNIERDARVSTALASQGWKLIRVWEHEDIQAAGDRILAHVSLAQTHVLG